MYAIVLAACLLMPATDVTPQYEKCSLILNKEKFETLKLCEAEAAKQTKQIHDKEVRITGHKCVDLDKIKSTPDSKQPVSPPTSSPEEKNQVDPNLKPLSPEQKKQGFESL